MYLILSPKYTSTTTLNSEECLNKYGKRGETTGTEWYEGEENLKDNFK